MPPSPRRTASQIRPDLICDRHRYAIATTVGCLSLVVPDFARAPFDLRNVASYRLDGRGVWRALTTGQVAQMISIKD